MYTRTSGEVFAPLWPEQAHAHHGEAVAVEVAGVAHGHADDLAVMHGPAERLAAETKIGAGRGKRRIDRVECSVDRACAWGRGVAGVEIEEELGLERSLRRCGRGPLIGFRVRFRAGRRPDARRRELRSRASSAATQVPTDRLRRRPRTERKRRFRESCALQVFDRACKPGDDFVAHLVERRAQDRTVPGMSDPG